MNRAVVMRVGDRFYSKTDARGRVRFAPELSGARLYRPNQIKELTNLRKLLQAKGYRPELKIAAIKA